MPPVPVLSATEFRPPQTTSRSWPDAARVEVAVLDVEPYLLLNVEHNGRHQMGKSHCNRREQWLTATRGRASSVTEYATVSIYFMYAPYTLP
ncbi:hypothetical protein ROHU_018968 [Labeo rohita]|uniref:Uncharacterized protein n=1 Tax=Labeo rohita TaxID=84645 RepID=A0A498N6U5_LABRO|nr:hypothetical protein ROHU_018968 [Labeo rohita]